MSQNEQLVHDFYSNKAEEHRAAQSRAGGLEFHFTKKILERFVNKESTVIEIGCGTGYYGMFLSDRCKTYTGVDMSPKNIEVFNEKINSVNIKNISAMIGDAANLVNIANNAYDVVLVLGPMYHLPPEERELAFKEAKRICTDNGIIMFAYINKLGAYLQDGILSFPARYPNKDANECILVNEASDDNPGLFFFTTPEKMKHSAECHGLEIIKNTGVNFVFNKEQINNMDDAQFECWLEFSNYLCESETCTGLSVHSLLVCRK